ncbi:MAG: hypothetical protein AB1442_13465 [Nitrospirota bacterium]
MKLYIFEQLFSHHGYEYLVAILAMFVFIAFYLILNEEKKF